VAVTSGGTQIGQTGRESVIEASSLDGTSLTESCAVSPQSFQTGMLTGSVDASAIPAASFLSVNAQSGTSGASYSSGTPVTNFTLNAPAGSDRVEVLAFNSASQGAVETFSLVAAKNFSSQAAPGALNGGNTVVLGSADETMAAPITYNSVPSGFPSPSTIVIYQTAGGGAFLIANAATNQYPALSPGAIHNGDSYAFEATARDNFQAVSSFISAGAGGPVSFTFPTRARLPPRCQPSISTTRALRAKAASPRLPALDGRLGPIQRTSSRRLPPQTIRMERRPLPFPIFPEYRDFWPIRSRELRSSGQPRSRRTVGEGFRPRRRRQRRTSCKTAGRIPCPDMPIRIGSSASPIRASVRLF
jgi:hypothetical protein